MQIIFLILLAIPTPSELKTKPNQTKIDSALGDK